MGQAAASALTLGATDAEGGRGQTGALGGGGSLPKPHPRGRQESNTETPWPPPHPSNLVTQSHWSVTWPFV